MKSKSLSVVALGIVLVAAVAVGYLISRPMVMEREKVLPVFIGGELTIPQKVVQPISLTRVISAPIPQPKIATPLPIVPPGISYRVLPQYPATALQQGLEGVAILSVYIGLNGAAESVAIKSSSGVADLDKSALAAVSRWQFNPATQGGAALASWFELPVRFTLQ
ncbi:hypothetical protein A3F86_00700 [candidate division WOR-1 bacterium RIFCSPLOWO2_12_FULL_45_9]|uniref:TonB C-terminal domain-containing protein n=1 Tax=candidate division WOR-1 bacterium RIFCSPLOWO2_12_FULL_45_9 TaxID=1802568 RepID=A0A1F4RNY9_UNCSA|nr:MAG: hypothetical protein A3F86_00700 [candidate division WOR-1 bacterium RIFCSPLOWO2_12_FULL_45_9]